MPTNTVFRRVDLLVDAYVFSINKDVYIHPQQISTKQSRCVCLIQIS